MHVMRRICVKTSRSVFHVSKMATYGLSGYTVKFDFDQLKWRIRLGIFGFYSESVRFPLTFGCCGYSRSNAIYGDSDLYYVLQINGNMGKCRWYFSSVFASWARILLRLTGCIRWKETLRRRHISPVPVRIRWSRAKSTRWGRGD